MFSFDANRYGPHFGPLLAGERLAALGPGTPDPALRPRLQELSEKDSLAHRPIVDRDMARACLAGIWLYHDFLDESHTICQEVESATGSYWHAIVHRREPDYDNAKYWFRRVSEHAIFPHLQEESVRIAVASPESSTARTISSGTRWDAFAFIDLRAKYCGKGNEAEEICRRIQLIEWQLLFDHAFRHAFDDSAPCGK
jgi:hypothetical protein